MTLLKKCQREIQSIFAMLSHHYGLTCAIYDTNIDLVAYTDSYEKIWGTKVYKPPIERVFHLKQVVNTSPGEKDICGGCSCYHNCPATFEISQCVCCNGVPIGVLLFVSFSKSRRANTPKNIQETITLIEDCAASIGTIAAGKNSLEYPDAAQEIMKTTLEIAPYPLLAVNSNGSVLAENTAFGFFRDSQIFQEQTFLETLPKDSLYHLLSGKKLNNYIVSLQEDTQIQIETFPIFNAGGQLIATIIKPEYTKQTKSTFSEETSTLNQDIGFSIDDIIGTSPEIKQLKKQVVRIANSPSTVFIHGETGTGKGLIAKALHYESNRKEMPFISVNCSSIPESLFESELFGYEEGAFTGARKQGKPGKFELADGGTIFLDEVSEIPLNIQAKLLTVIQDRVVERIGGVTPRSIDIRIIAASNKDLLQMIQEKTFREDLYYRLNVLPVYLPALRERKQDIELLSEYFLARYNKILNKNVLRIDNEIMKLFQSYDWPGNIRQLQNIIEYCVNVTNRSILTSEDLPIDFVENKREPLPEALLHLNGHAEQKIILEMLNHYGWGVEQKKIIAKKLNMSLRTLYRKIQKYQIEPTFKENNSSEQ